MAPPGWANAAELVFLRQFLPEYEVCKANRKYGDIWATILRAYVEEFKPIEKWFPGVSDKSQLSDDGVRDYNDQYEKLKKRIQEWYRWQYNPRSRTFGKAVSTKDLKKIYSDRTRSSKPYEVFARLNATAVDSAVNAACIVEKITGKARLKVWHHIASKMYNNGTDEQKKAVQEELLREEKGQGEGEEEDCSSPEGYERFLNRLPSILQTVLDPIVRKAGVMALVTYVGPSPSAGGQIIAKSAQFGDEDQTPHFGTSWGGYERFCDALARFAGEHLFSEEVCASRSLGGDSKGEGPSGMTQEGPSGMTQEGPSGMTQEGPSGMTQEDVDVVGNGSDMGSYPNEPGPLSTSPSTDPSSSAHPQNAPTTASPTEPMQHVFALPSTTAPLAPAAPLAPPVTGMSSFAPTTGLSIIPLSSSMITPPAPHPEFSQFAAPPSSISVAIPATEPPLHPGRQLMQSYIDSQNLGRPQGPELMLNLYENEQPATWSDFLNKGNGDGVDLSSYMNPSATGNHVWADLSIFEKVAHDATLDDDSEDGESPMARVSKMLQTPEFSRDTFEPMYNQEPPYIRIGSTIVPNPRSSSLANCPINGSNLPPGSSGTTPWSYNTGPSSTQTGIGAQTFDTLPVSSTVSNPFSNDFGAAPTPSLPPTYPLGGGHSNNDPSFPTAGHSHASGAPVNNGNTTPSLVPPVITAKTDNTPPSHHNGEVNTAFPQTNAGSNSQTSAQLPPVHDVNHRPPPNVAYHPTSSPQSSIHLGDNIYSGIPSTSASAPVHSSNPVNAFSSASESPAPAGGSSPCDEPVTTTSSAIHSPANSPCQLHPPAETADSDKNGNTASDSSAADPNMARRSGRQRIPSTRNDQANAIGENPPPVVPEDLLTDLSAPDWFVAAIKHMMLSPLGDDWARAVLAYFNLEKALGYGKIGKTSPPVAKRPSEWSKFTAKTKHGVRSYDDLPFIESFPEFGKALTEWWVTLQPFFRVSEGKLLPIYAVPESGAEAWSAARKSGQNGLVSVMTMLAWWGRGAQSSSPWVEDSVTAWRATVLDVTMCMKEMLKTVAPAFPTKDNEKDDNPIEPPTTASAGKRSRKHSAKADTASKTAPVKRSRKAPAQDNSTAKPMKKARK